jgi:hypothetical protein
LTCIGLSTLFMLFFNVLITKKVDSFLRNVYACLALTEILISGTWVAFLASKQQLLCSSRSSATADLESTDKLFSPTTSIHTRLLQVLEDEHLRGLFEQFLVREFAVEKLLFWVAVRKFKETFPSKDSSTMAVDIYKEFCAVDARISLNLSSKTRDTLCTFFKEENLESLSSTVFDAAMHEVLKVLAYDSFARFVSQTKWHSNSSPSTDFTSIESS